MHLSRAFLEKCWQLKLAGFNPALEAGMRIARGYADIGFETFLFLQEDKLLSLHTGQISSLPPEQQEHFFAVLTCDEMVDALLKLGFDIESLIFFEQRHWVLKLRAVPSQLVLKFKALTLEDVFVEALSVACAEIR